MRMELARMLRLKAPLSSMPSNITKVSGHRLIEPVCLHWEYSFRLLCLSLVGFADGAQKRPRRLTAGDRGLAQALQFERPRKAAATGTPKAVSADVKPSPPSLAAAMKRPKRVTAGLKGIAIAAENAKSGTPRVKHLLINPLGLGFPSFRFSRLKNVFA